LFKVPVEGGKPVRLTKGLASNPVWSPDGSIIVYAGPVVGISGPMLMVNSEGVPVESPSIQVRTGGERYRFVPGKQEVVYLTGEQSMTNQTFRLLDLTTKRVRQLSTFDNPITRTFDISPDGKQIVFDRLRDNSDIVLIDLPEKSK
jgi:Tol biopolymer transport system component